MTEELQSNVNDKSEQIDKTTSNASKISSIKLLKDGFNFHFEYEEHQVHAWGSAKSGKEFVEVNGALVSEKRSLSRRSVHTFSIDNVDFEIEFQTVSLLTGELHCSLIKEGVHVETLKQVPKYTANKKQAKWRIALWFVIGFFFGMFAVDSLIALFS